jgi:methionine-rich copper-binding protein CopC
MKKVTLLAIMVFIAISFNNAFAAENNLDKSSSNLTIEQVKPGYSGITLQFNSPENQVVYLNLVDAQGKVVMTKEIEANKGLNTEMIEMDVQQLGFLVIMLNNTVEQTTKRIIANGEYAIVN